MNTEKTCLCKICEKPILTEKLCEHSIKCKEVAEMKQKVLLLKEKLFALIDKAHQLKTQINSNTALQRYIEKMKWLS